MIATTETRTGFANGCSRLRELRLRATANTATVSANETSGCNVKLSVIASLSRSSGRIRPANGSQAHSDQDLCGQCGYRNCHGGARGHRDKYEQPVLPEKVGIGHRADADRHK